MVLMENKSKPGAKPGNQNAVKDDCATASLHIRCKPLTKEAWIKAAEAQNLKLTAWIIKALDGAV